MSFGLALRFATGVFLAGVYPAGLKVMAGWFTAGRGMALGVLVGALAVGSASPHLVRSLGLDWRGVVVAASALAVIAGLLMTRVADGPYETASQKFRWAQIGLVIRNRGVRLSTYGYLGHMWELYAMWTWTAAFFAASAAEAATSYGSIPLITFFVIGIGGLGSWLAGSLSDRLGRTKVAWRRDGHQWHLRSPDPIVFRVGGMGDRSTDVGLGFRGCGRQCPVLDHGHGDR